MKKILISVLVLVVLVVGGIFGYSQYVSFNKQQIKEKQQQEKVLKQKQTKLAQEKKLNEINQKYDKLISDIKKSNANQNTQNQEVGGGFEKPSNEEIKADKVFDDEKYGDLTDNTFSLFTHNQSNLPLIISIHGGAFLIGNKEMEYGSLKKFYDLGYNVMSINYTLSGTKKFPQAVYDVKEAVKYVKENYKNLNLKNDKIILKGESAGGNLAALAALSSSENTLNNPVSKFTNVDSKVLGVIDQFGPIDFANVEEELKLVGVTPKMGVPTNPNSPEVKYLGESVTKDSKLAQQSNPTNYINKNMPSIFIQAGYKDNMVGVLQSVNFAKNIELKLLNQSNKVQTTWFENAGHGGVEFDSVENIKKLSDWIKTLK